MKKHESGKILYLQEVMAFSAFNHYNFFPRRSYPFVDLWLDYLRISIYCQINHFSSVSLTSYSRNAMLSFLSLFFFFTCILKSLSFDNELHVILL